MEWDWIHLVLRPLFGLFYQPHMIMMIVEYSVECELAGETEVLGVNLPQYHFVHHKYHMTWPGFEPGPPRWEPATNRLSYGTALAARSKLWNAFARSDAGIVGSNSTQGMHDSLRLFCLCRKGPCDGLGCPKLQSGSTMGKRVYRSHFGLKLDFCTHLQSHMALVIL
jgi:hypothetical protein